jgi:hypothetical protein
MYDPQAQHVRECLITYDKMHCIALTGRAQRDCRWDAHVDCYTKYLYTPFMFAYYDYFGERTCTKIALGK